MNLIVFHQDLTPSDAIILRKLADDISRHQDQSRSDSSYGADAQRDAGDLLILKSLNDPADKNFEPSIFMIFNTCDLPSCLPSFLYNWIFCRYLTCARKIVRFQADVVILTHLLFYFITSVPGAAFFFYRFSYPYSIFFLLRHTILCYSLVMHQHIYIGGIFAKKPGLRIINAFPLHHQSFNTPYLEHRLLSPR